MIALEKVRSIEKEFWFCYWLDDDDQKGCARRIGAASIFSGAQGTYRSAGVGWSIGESGRWRQGSAGTDGIAMRQTINPAPDKPERTRQGAKGERTRGRIKAAFADLLGAKSFTSVTIADICRTSDITVGGFYFHFGSQEALLDEVMTEYIEALVGDFEAALEDRPRGGLADAVCGAFLKAYSERVGLARTFQQLTRMRSDYALRWRLASEAAMEMLADRLRAERPDLAPDRARFLAYGLVTMIISRLDLVYVYRDRSGRTATPPREALGRDLVEFWKRMAASRDAA
jgi:AcrR family transcriptional regulator